MDPSFMKERNLATMFKMALWVKVGQAKLK
jgi:hypothetical protein